MEKHENSLQKSLQIGDEHLMTTSEVAARMGVNIKFARDLIKAGLIPSLRFRKHSKVSYSRFVEFLKKHEGEDLYLLLDKAQLATEVGTNG